MMVRGRVQGVGFRYYVLRRARDLGLTGWVRNRGDGAVEVTAEGDAAALASLREAVGHGPSPSLVDGVEEQWGEGPPRYTQFGVGREFR